jgi:hypothetical protein
MSFECYTGFLEDKVLLLFFIQYPCLCNVFVDRMSSDICSKAYGVNRLEYYLAP